jgi:hypothetical protein
VPADNDILALIARLHGPATPARTSTTEEGYFFASC